MNEGYTRDNRYSQDITIPCYDTDASFRLKPASFMDLAQEIAYRAATAMGFGYEALKENHAAWVLSRMCFKIHTPALWRDETTLFTWHKGLSGPFFVRDFELRRRDDTDFADKSKVLVSCTTSWIGMNMDTRRVVMSDKLLDMVPGETSCPDDAIVENCGKVVMPKSHTSELVATRVIQYSDVDINQHANNARYIVWAMDCMDYDLVTSKAVKEVRINFNKEAKPGDTVELYRSVTGTPEAPTWCVEGKVEGKSCFCAQFDF